MQANILVGAPTMKTKRIVFSILFALAVVGVGLWIRSPSLTEEKQRLSGEGTTSTGEQSGVLDATGSIESKVEHSTEPTPEMLESLTTATAQITRGDGSRLDIRSIDHEYDPLTVDPNEKLKMRVALKGYDKSRPILIEADNGGSLNQKVGPLSLMPDSENGVVEFQYAVGGNTGNYTLFLSQGDRQEFMELWAGPEMPVGQSGPTRSFNPEYLQSKRMGQ